MSACADHRCDGSGFLFDEATRRAVPCSCRPAKMARKRAAAVAGRLPRRYHGVSFDREPIVSIARTNPAVFRAVRSYAARVGDRLNEGRGLWFVGDVGTGKTTLAMLVSKAAMEADRTVAIYSLPRLLGLVSDTYDDDAAFSFNELIDRLCAVDLLHIDDVGAQQSNPWVLDQLYTIVNTRYEDGRAMVLTTNLDLNDLEEQIGRRTVSRLHEMCGEPLPMFGDDQRREPENRSYVSEQPVPDEDAEWERAGSAPGYGSSQAGLGRRLLD